MFTNKTKNLVLKSVGLAVIGMGTLQSGSALAIEPPPVPRVGDSIYNWCADRNHEAMNGYRDEYTGTGTTYPTPTDLTEVGDATWDWCADQIRHSAINTLGYDPSDPSTPDPDGATGTTWDSYGHD